MSSGIDRADQRVLVVEHVTILNWDGTPTLEGGSVAVEGQRIVEVSAGAISGSWRRWDGHGRFLMPGLIDAHMHYYGSRVPDPEREWGVSPLLSAVRAAQDATRMLRMGVTVTRDCGSRAGVAIRNAVQEGALIGPRVLAANMGITSTGGHADIASISLGQVRERPYQAYLADGPDNVRATVRRTVREGADHIKVWVTGGILAEHDDPTQVQYTAAELSALVDEAHRLGRRVAAHCHNVEGTHRALDAGVNSIEHGHLLDDSACQRMRDQRVFLVPTMSFLNRAAAGNIPGLPTYARDKAREMLSVAVATLERAARMDVPIAMGSDAFSEPASPFDRTLEELAFMVEAGMDADGALRAATVGSAEAVGLPDRGAIRPGNIADMVLTGQNPAEDVRVLTDPGNIWLVMKEGQIVVDRTEELE